MTSSAVLKQLQEEEIIATEPWENALLFQPFEAEQILLAENASCLAVKAFLKMCKLSFDVQSRGNAEFMSPGGRMTKLPVLKVGEFVIAEFEPILNFVENKGISLSKHWMDEDQRSDLRAYISLVENIFTNAELYFTFVDKKNYTEITFPRNGCNFPWPLNYLENLKKKRKVYKQLHVYQWVDMKMEDVVEKVSKCCEALSEKLENNPYFYGKSPTELDAIVFGHIFTLVTTLLPNNVLAETVRKYTKLHNFCLNIETTYFS